MYRILLFSVLLMLTIPLGAGVKVTAVHEGTPVEDAELCFYTAMHGDPFVALLGPELRCYPANKVLNVPPRTLGMFVRRHPDLITPHHGLITGTGRSVERIEESHAELSRAALLDHSQVDELLGSNGHVSLIIAPTDTNRPASMPLERNRSISVVPAGVALVPTFIRDGRIVCVGETFSLTEGERRKLEWDGGCSENTTLVRVYAEPPPTFSETKETTSACPMPYPTEFLKLAHEQAAPTLELIDSAGAIHTSEIKLARDIAAIFDAIFVFRDVAPGTAVVRSRGGRWQTTETKVVIPAKLAGTLADPVLIDLGGDLKVTSRGAPGMAPTAKSCDASSEETPIDAITMRLSKCRLDLEDSVLSAAYLSQCESVEAKEGDSEDTAVFHGLAPGKYVATIHRGDRIVAGSSVDVLLGSTATVHLEREEFFVAGRLTRGHQPIDATIHFQNGQAASDKHTGEYVALLPAPVGKAPVNVVACDESFIYVHIPKHEIPNGAGYDIEIPNNTLKIRVFEEGTTERPKGAQVSGGFIRSEERPDTMIAEFPVDDSGDEFLVSHLDNESLVRVCALAEGYKISCSDPIKIERPIESVELYLKPQRHKAQILAEGYTTAYFVKSDGTVAQQIKVNEKGEFWFDQPGANEHIVIVGSAPLVAAPVPLHIGDVYKIDVGAQAPRAIEIRLGAEFPQERAIFGLTMNGLRIPIRALVQHQRSRKQGWYLTKGVPLTIRDIDSNAAIIALTGPDPKAFNGSLDNPALFSGQVPRRVVGTNVVVFE